MTPYEVLYGKSFRSSIGWFETGEARMLGTYLVHDALDKVKLNQNPLRTTPSRQKSYAVRKVHDVAYIECEKVLLKVLPTKNVMRFWKKGKLSQRFFGPFEILERVGEVAYRLVLPPILTRVHMIFHVSMIRKHYDDKSHILDFSTVQLDENLTYEEEPVAIVDRKVRNLRSNDVSSVKVLWKGQPTKYATWESSLI
ncbi:uncharacterized protein [Nicotiana tomentosiformis]|uniref:uncharacterized protein n=1 Tax=Nicotiana tomentosiformis TaxID=4098 RepID=UPI00388C5476